MFFKISQKANRWIAAAAIIQCLFLIASVVTKIGHLTEPPAIYYLSSTLMEILTFLLILYLVNVLIFFEEKSSIVTAFTIYICLYVLRTIDTLSAGNTFQNTIAIVLGTATFVVSIYLFFRVLQIKADYIRAPYRLFGYGLLILVLLEGFTPLVFPFIIGKDKMAGAGMLQLRQAINYMGILSLLTPIAVLLVIKGVSRFIEDEKSGKIKRPKVRKIKNR